MPRDLHDAIKATAAENERSMAEEMRHALRQHVERGWPGFPCDAVLTRVGQSFACVRELGHKGPHQKRQASTGRAVGMWSGE